VGPIYHNVSRGFKKIYVVDGVGGKNYNPKGREELLL
jgi:hypothetical protein